jgi:hypothetical protein
LVLRFYMMMMINKKFIDHQHSILEILENIIFFLFFINLNKHLIIFKNSVVYWRKKYIKFVLWKGLSTNHVYSSCWVPFFSIFFIVFFIFLLFILCQRMWWCIMGTERKRGIGGLLVLLHYYLKNVCLSFIIFCLQEKLPPLSI